MEGHTIVEASTGEDGLKIAPAFRPDMVILDISLAGDIDGIETLKRLRTDTAFDKTPVVALTAHAMKNDEEAIMDAGFDHYMTKPIVDFNEFKIEINERLVKGRSNGSNSPN
jgi:two-component system cell cycle response regulator DivK